MGTEDDPNAVLTTLAEAPRDGDAGETKLDARYDARGVLGEGGMGEVRLCHDRRIGRDVAVKVLREVHGARAEIRARLEREAFVLGQLEHPNIVPLYDQGTDDAGAPYFTMRRLAGQTLEDVLEGLRAGGHPGLAQTYSTSRLLAVFSSICQAVAYAHARGIVHRDLKPANVMLGEFGEVYVVDWGLAKQIGVPDLPVIPSGPASGQYATRMGDAIGTPGYMAPEQIRGEVDRVDERTDVYALGAILFELLTLQPLHEGSNVAALYTSTLEGADARASRRTPTRTVPPELEAVCVRATRHDAAERFATVKELLGVVERFLAGDRDLERRRAVAAEHARAAEAAAETSRETALREASAALALDPAQKGALAVLARVLLTAPSEMPPDARRALDDTGRVVQREGARSSLLLYLGWLGFAPLLILIGVRNWPLFAAGMTMLAVAIGAAALALQPRLRMVAGFGAFVAASILIGLLSTLLGPHIIVPNLASTAVLAFVLYGDPRLRVPAVALAVAGFVVPWLLQLGGVVPASYAFGGGGFAVRPQLVDLPEWGVHVTLVLASLALVIPIGAFVGKLRDQVERSEEALFLQAWTLRKLLPDEITSPSSSRTSG